ncbi:hypothetical protein OIU78_007347 [Salix suchowensis]|nr:hypothetical protein OIU78_007347 [Salix suchowensis]
MVRLTREAVLLSLLCLDVLVVSVLARDLAAVKNEDEKVWWRGW